MSSIGPARVISPHFSPERKRLLNKSLTPRPDQIEAHGTFFDVRRYRPGAAHLRGLGERPIAEFLQEVGVAHGIEDDILERLDRWRDHLTPELLRAIGADCWPPALAMLRGGRR